MKKSELINLIKNFERKGERIIIAIDGKCASGKTTLAKFISNNIDCDIVHTDDFFLPPEKRTEERLLIPGGNMDRERLLTEILLPLKNGEDYVYNKFSCRTMDFLTGEKVIPKAITVVEGSYSCHPDLFDFYALHIFSDIDSQTQRQRISERNKDNKNDFFTKWIPLEEKYFAEFAIKEKCDVIINGSH